MKNLIKTAMLSVLVVASTLVYAEDKAELNFETIQVSPGIYMLMGVNGFAGGNIGLSVGEDGVVLIDDAMPPTLDIMLNAIKKVTNKPIDYLINTHVHADHIGNNETLGKNGAQIVAHDNLRTHLLTKGVDTADGNKPAPKAALPVITFSHEMSFHLNGDDAHLFHVANAHTDGDAVIHFKKSNVIHTGDTFFNSLFPYIDIGSGGSIDGYIKAQQKVFDIANEQTKIIPGHGSLATKKDLQMSIDMLITARKTIAALIVQGKSEDEAVAMNPLADYDKKWSWGFITAEKMTRQVYKSLATAKKAAHQHSDTSSGHAH